MVKLLSVSGYHPSLMVCAGCGDGGDLVGFGPQLVVRCVPPVVTKTRAPSNWALTGSNCSHTGLRVTSATAKRQATIEATHGF